jgi:hypothetical protein
MDLDVGSVGVSGRATTGVRLYGKNDMVVALIYEDCIDSSRAAF